MVQQYCYIEHHDECTVKVLTVYIQHSLSVLNSPNLFTVTVQFVLL